MERISDQVKLPFGDSWFSHVDHLICFVALQCEVCAFNLTFPLLQMGLHQIEVQTGPHMVGLPTGISQNWRG